jgi:hypothetical protein
MYIITANGRSNIYHLARLNDDNKSYSAACGYYNYVLPGNSLVMLVDKVADDRRRCKACEAADNQVQP